MPNKMTDNEIKEYDDMTPLEQLNFYRNRYYNDGGMTENGIVANAINDVFSQINQQKAEIERLEQNLEEAHIDIREHIAEIERYKTESQMADGYAEALEERAKAEAVKEFAERLKEYAFRDSDGFYTVMTNQIDNLLKEMVGENDADT